MEEFNGSKYGNMDELSAEDKELIRTRAKSWGVDIRDSVHSNDPCCLEGCSYNISKDDFWVKNIVGYSRESRAFIISCPFCQRRFWFHASIDCLPGAIEECPKWPE